MDINESIKSKALDLGFDLVGITHAGQIDPLDVQKFSEWSDSGFCGQMEYMRRNHEKRVDPSKLMDGAKSVICVGLNYKPDENVDDRQSDSTKHLGRVANFAIFEDYHDFMKVRLRELVSFITEQVGGEIKCKICVDSVPLAERALAVRAGLGFIGKNHMLINPAIGSQIFLGEIITDIELTPDDPFVSDCPGCEKCIRACPTGALRRDGSFDASKCNSYLTIEHKDDISEELGAKIGDRVFGCDECVKVCPYDLPCNAAERKNKELKVYPERQMLDLEKILSWQDEQFKEFFFDSCVKRIGLERLKRNARICLENIS
jgi:epoxyqueuosine reductase